jgi:hypothetical protein
MKGHRLLQPRIWMLLPLAVVLIAGHGMILYHLSSHLALSAGVVSFVTAVVVIKHLGFLTVGFRLHGLLGRRSRR